MKDFGDLGRTPKGCPVEVQIWMPSLSTWAIAVCGSIE